MALIPSISAARWLLLLIALAAIYFFYGFIVPVLAALVIGFATWPIYRDILRRTGNRRTIAASIAIILIIAFLVLPIVFAVIYTSGEVKEWFTWALHVNRFGAPTPLWIMDLPIAGPWLNEQWTHYVGVPGAIGEMAQVVSGANIGNIYRAVLAAGGGAFHVILTLLFMMIALFFVYRDGIGFVRQLDLIGERIFPNRWARISRVVPITISSTVMGMTVIAIGEGIVLGVAYWIAGVPSPVTLGVLTGVMALIPGGAPCRSRWSPSICSAAVPRSPASRCSSGARSSFSSSTRRCDRDWSAAPSSCRSCRRFSASSAASRRWAFSGCLSVRC